MSAADTLSYTEDHFRARVNSNLKYPQYGGLLGSVANAMNEAIDSRWRIKRLRRMAGEYGLKLTTVLSYQGTTIEEIQAFRKGVA